MIVFEHFIRVGEFNATPPSAIIVGPAVLLIFHNYSVQSYDIFKYRGIDTIGPSPHDPQVSNCKHAIVAVDLAIWQVGQRFYQPQLRPLQPVKRRTLSTSYHLPIRDPSLNSIWQRASICKKIWSKSSRSDITFRHHIPQYYWHTSAVSFYSLRPATTPWQRNYRTKFEKKYRRSSILALFFQSIKNARTLQFRFTHSE